MGTLFMAKKHKFPGKPGVTAKDEGVGLWQQWFREGRQDGREKVKE
jgi:hypothetical protein